jgi:3D (Asp-Asp-Asp) domain-containing protein
MSVKEFKEQAGLAQKELDKRHEENLKRPKPNKFNKKPFLSRRDAKLGIILIGIIGLVGSLIFISQWFDDNRLVWQMPILLRTPVYSEKRVGVAKALPTTEESDVPSPTPTATPTPTPLVKKAKVSAYSCGGLKTEAEIKMNCPSLLRGEPKTATGTTPIPYRTMACDRANLGRTFEIEGIGQVVCNDTGGAIKGSGRFDLYLETVEEARQFGVRELAYRLVE